MYESAWGNARKEKVHCSECRCTTTVVLVHEFKRDMPSLPSFKISTFVFQKTLLSAFYSSKNIVLPSYYPTSGPVKEPVCSNQGL
jgi:hypothetical protein